MDENSIITIIFFVVNLVIAGFVAFGTTVAKMSQYKEKVDNLKEEKDEAKKKIDALRSDVDKLLEFKGHVQKFMDDKIYTKKSPLDLTEFGQKLLNDSDFHSIFNTEKDNLIKILEEKYHPATKYDVQEKARELMDGLADHSPFSPLKTYAFNNGIDYNQILRAGAIPLRDYYFEKHPDLK